jgi:type III secretion protein J
MSELACRSIALALVLLLASACRETLRTDLTEDQANQIAVALDAARIAAIKIANPAGGNGARFAVQVASGDLPSALRVLQRERLPRPELPGFAELYGDGGLVATPNEERARWAAATAGELSRSLERLAGVNDARVHVAPAETPLALDAAPRPAKASVLLRRKAGAPPIDEAEVRALVAGAVDGLAPEHVVVTQTRLQAGGPPLAGLVHVGPISVTRSSARALKLVLGGALAFDLLLAVAVIALWRDRRRARPPRVGD